MLPLKGSRLSAVDSLTTFDTRFSHTENMDHSANIIRFVFGDKGAPFIRLFTLFTYMFPIITTQPEWYRDYASIQIVKC